MTDKQQPPTTRAIEIKIHVIFTPWDDVDSKGRDPNHKHLTREQCITGLQNEIRQVMEEQIPEHDCCTPLFGWKEFTDKDL